MFVLAQLFFDVRPSEQDLLSFTPPLLVLGEFDAVHHEFRVTFLDRLYFHAVLLRCPITDDLQI